MRRTAKIPSADALSSVSAKRTPGDMAAEKNILEGDHIKGICDCDAWNNNAFITFDLTFVRGESRVAVVFEATSRERERERGAREEKESDSQPNSQLE